MKIEDKMRLEGYDQAIDDIREWWDGYPGQLIPKAWASKETVITIQELWGALHDKKKERFGPEPEKWEDLPNSPTVEQCSECAKQHDEHGYNQAMDDFRKAWIENENEQWGDDIWVRVTSGHLWLALKAGKKERFGPEPKIDDYQRCLDYIGVWYVENFMKSRFTGNVNAMLKDLLEILRDKK